MQSEVTAFGSSKQRFSVLLKPSITREKRSLLLTNILSVGLISALSGSIWTIAVIETYICLTYAFISLVDSQQCSNCKRYLYCTYLSVHVFIFMFAQHAGLIGILNLENSTSPKTLACLMGFSFYILQSISICAGVARGSLRSLGFSRYHLAVSFFGAFIAGPLFNTEQLEKFGDLKVKIPRLNDVYENLNVLSGSLLFKFVLAAWLGKWVNIAEIESPLSIAKSVLCFELQVYFDFAGYSLLAIFFCRIFGIPIYYNFRHPFAARDIPEFWRRWHIGLGTWFKEQVFIPIRTSFKGLHIAYEFIPPLLVFLISAAWHGPTKNFLIWGLFHGLAFIFAVHAISRIKSLFAKRIIAKLYFITVVFYGRLLFMDSDYQRLKVKFTKLGMFKHMGRELASLMPHTLDAFFSILKQNYENVVVASLIGALICYELFSKSAREKEPYCYFRPGMGSVLVFLVTLLLIQPLSKAGFVYGR